MPNPVGLRPAVSAEPVVVGAAENLAGEVLGADGTLENVLELLEHCLVVAELLRTQGGQQGFLVGCYVPLVLGRLRTRALLLRGLE